MGEGKRQMAQSECSPYVGHGRDHDDKRTIMDGEDDDHTYMNVNATSPSSSTSSLGDSTVSNGSSFSSSEMVDDASSSSTNSSSSSSLYDLSDLMAQLPIKRGLSKFYNGKSESFTTLSRVTSVEDLPKKETLSRRQMIKASKSYAGGLDRCKSYTLIPKPSISKKTSRASFSSLSSTTSRRSSFVSSCRPPLVPPSQNKFE